MWLHSIIYSIAFTITPKMLHNTNTHSINTNIISTNKFRINMVDDNLNFTNFYESNNQNENLVLYSQEKSNKVIVKWISYISELPKEPPNFIYNNLVNALIYTRENNDKYNIYVAYQPKTLEEPAYIAFLKVNAPQHILTVNHICGNPALDTSYISLFNRELVILSKKSGVHLDIKPLRNQTDKRYYYNFIFNI